ncbi:hypothetical protein [Natrinema sp. 74]|uniref:hypothetical protein n=1 Tax=Natrinema sp. 74 TaxID=3384159 RepID=UPI0038D4F76B
MRLSSRAGTDHATLALIELVAVPVAALTTVLTLALADIGFVALRAAVAAAGGGHAVVDLGPAILAFGALLALATGAGLLVAGYRRYVATRFDDVSPLPLLLVPVIGVVAPIGYAVWNTGALWLPSWLLVPVAIAAHALAYRTIALDSLREDRGPASLVVGSLTALPAVVTLVDLANGALGPNRPIGRTLEGVVAGTGSPIVRTAVIAVPLLVATLYGIGSLSGVRSQWKVPDWSIPRPRLSRFDHPLWNRSEPSGRQPAGTSAGRASSESDRSSSGSARPDRHRPSNAVVPSSPGTQAARGGHASPDDDSGSSTDTAASQSTGDRAADSADATERDDRPASEEPDHTGTDVPESGENDSADASEPAENAGEAADSSPDETAGSSPDGTGSDTQIFVDDFDQYVADETPVDRCPDCDKEIPSDGVYNFCPFCGGEL